MTDILEKRKRLREEKITARNQLSFDERSLFSEQISEKLLGIKEFQKSQKIMVYRSVKGEVCLDSFIQAAEALGKSLAYPLCISDTEMIALQPERALSEGRSPWKAGRFGIQEPIREASIEFLPEEIDLIICPCTVFDEHRNRMGMGAGFYDRYLKKCINAVKVAVAFEVQKVEHIPTENWDIVMDAVITEKRIFRKRHCQP